MGKKEYLEFKQPYCVIVQRKAHRLWKFGRLQFSLGKSSNQTLTYQIKLN